MKGYYHLVVWLEATVFLYKNISYQCILMFINITCSKIDYNVLVNKIVNNQCKLKQLLNKNV